MANCKAAWQECRALSWHNYRGTMFKQGLGPSYLFISGLLFFSSLYTHMALLTIVNLMFKIRIGQNENELECGFNSETNILFFPYFHLFGGMRSIAFMYFKEHTHKKKQNPS